MNICYIVAKEDEAAPFVDRFNVEKVEGAFNPLPCILYQKKLNGEHVLNIVVNGTQHGSSLVGCEAATLTTIKAIETLQPDIVINSGTCGAFKKYGAEIGKVYIGSEVMFHDRRVMGDDEWGTQTLGNYPLSERSKEIAVRFRTTRLNNSSPFSAISVHYPWKKASQLIARKYLTPKATVEAWSKNKSQHAIICKSGYNKVGTACYMGKDGHLYWVAFLAKK